MFGGLKESLSSAVIESLMSIGPKHLGRLLNALGYGQCPRHPGATGNTAVHEHGVRFPCGCCRWLPPLHRRAVDTFDCVKCNPIEESNVIQFRRSA